MPLERIEVNYKNKKRYKTNKLPIRQPIYLTWLIGLLSKIMLTGKKYKIEKVNMDGLKPPYLMLSNHMYFVDFELSAIGLFPHRMNNVVNIDGFYRRPWLMEWIGSIGTRKFSNDRHLIKSILHCLKRGDAVGMYPEARYSACGELAFLPDSLGKLVKLAKVPIVAVVHQGNHLYTPFFDWRHPRKVPLQTRMEKILTVEDIERLSVEEINKILKEKLYYNEYDYQLNNNILIKDKHRAEGLHKILYQCPHCLKEGVMNSKGHQIYCEECGVTYNLNENGTLEAVDTLSKFTKVLDWYHWERENVRKEILNGTYNFSDEVEVYGLPRCWKFIKLGDAKVTHTIEEGFVLEGHHNKQDYRIIREPIKANSLHIEFDYCYMKPEDAFYINCEDDSYLCYPKKKNVVTKLSFAVEELYQLHLKRLK